MTEEMKQKVHQAFENAMENHSSTSGVELDAFADVLQCLSYFAPSYDDGEEISNYAHKIKELASEMPA